MTKSMCERKAELTVNIAVSLLESGAEVKRAEESAERIGRALGAVSCEVLALVSFILVTFNDESGESITKSRRVRAFDADFTRFERLNLLSRRICEGKISLTKAEKEFESANEKTYVKPMLRYVESMAVAFSFAVFFGGGVLEAISSALSSVTVPLMKTKMGAFIENKLILTCFTSFVAGAACLMSVKMGLTANYDVVAIGNIMLLVPGISLMSAGRDLVSGDLLSGIMRLSESVLTALAIAVGFALPSLLL